MFTWMNLVFEGIVLAFIVIARRNGLSGAEIGLLITAVGIASLAGAALSPRLQKLLSMRAIVVGSFWIQLLVGVYLAFPNVYVLIAAFLPSAFFGPTLNAVVIGYRVAMTPDRLTGRVNSVARTIAVCGAPLGSLTAGFLLASFSARTTIGAFVGMLAVLVAIATLSPSFRNAPSLDELKPVEPTEPVFPELVG
jgi:predicted MFS family arabinose efflux permease